MAEEFPYFRFTPQEWQNGSISLLSFDHKGLFSDIMSYYWVKDCSVTKEMLELKFKGEKELLEDLYKYVIEYDEETDFITIGFLDDQFDMLSELRKSRQMAGRKGGKHRSSKPKAKPKQSKSSGYEKKFNFKKSLLDLGVEKENVEAWLEARKKKKAANTEVAFNAIKIQVDKCPASANECIRMAAEKSWSGFKAQWYINEMGSAGKGFSTGQKITGNGKERSY